MAQQGPDTQEAEPHGSLGSVSGCRPGITLYMLGDTKMDFCCVISQAAYPPLRALSKWGPGSVSAVVQAAAVSVLQGSQSGCKSLTEVGLSSLIGNNLFESFFIKIQME